MRFAPGRLWARLPQPLRWITGTVGAAVVVAGLLLFGFRAMRGGALPGTTVVGVEVGGLSGDALDEAIERAADREAERELTVEVGAGNDATYARGEIGAALDVDATRARVLERGRQSNPLAALVDHVRATFAETEIAPEIDVDRNELRIWSRAAAERLTDPPFPGGIEIEDGQVTGMDPRPGSGILADGLARAVERVIRQRGGDLLALEPKPIEPATDAEDVRSVVRKARRALEGEVTLTRPEGTLTVTPEQMAGALRARVAPDDAGSLELHIRPATVSSLVTDPERFDSDPVDASFAVDGDGVRIVPSEPGFRFSAARVARQLVKVALSSDRTAQMKGEEVEAEFTRKEAEDLNITEQVSTFTTYHSCCEPRVTNIHRIADIVDGTVVEPGETFSLNDFVGPRTTDKGFVPAPSIRDGEFVAEVGGGISQFATTFFNAIFFGGYDFLEYQAHSYYISRYPRGREATISTPAPDLEFLNDSDSGIYIDTAYTDTSITVSFYGSAEQEIEAIMGEPFNVKPPPEECRANKDLAKGEERTVQSGITGFDVVVKRVFEPSGRTEEFRTRYLAQPRIVERRRCD